MWTGVFHRCIAKEGMRCDVGENQMAKCTRQSQLTLLYFFITSYSIHIVNMYSFAILFSVHMSVACNLLLVVVSRYIINNKVSLLADKCQCSGT